MFFSSLPPPLPLFKTFSNFFDVDLFFPLSLYWICYNIDSVLCFGFLVMRHVGPRPRIKPAPPALEGEILSAGPPGRSRPYFLLVCSIFCCYLPSYSQQKAFPLRSQGEFMKENALRYKSNPQWDTTSHPLGWLWWQRQTIRWRNRNPLHCWWNWKMQTLSSQERTIKKEITSNFLNSFSSDLSFTFHMLSNCCNLASLRLLLRVANNFW